MAAARVFLALISGSFLILMLYLDLTAPIPPTIIFTVLAALVFVGSLFECHRYKRLHSDKPDLEWQETSERFIDAETGKLVTVYYHQKSGKRRYVAAASDEADAGKA